MENSRNIAIVKKMHKKMGKRPNIDTSIRFFDKTL